ncbi:phage tail tip lysozyme [Paracoccus sp. ME4]|uniref:phage tail tip lysozyme n=1 Tax=Paracoccus sp. ME4 TaxID=3138066 RepID=UPI00398B14B7
MTKRKITAAVTAAGIALFAGAADAETIPERLMGDLARDFDLQGFQAAGVVGNLARETGNFRFMQELEPIVDGSRGGIGYSQWTASRRLSFEAYAGSLEKQLTYEVNYGFLKKELTEEYAEVMADVRGSRNLWESTVIFMRGYLKPKKNENNVRVSMNYANAYLGGDFSGSGCQRRHEVRIDGRRMMISACPDANMRVAGVDVDVVLAASPRPKPRPDTHSAPVRLADAGIGARRPRARPDPQEPSEDHREAVRDAVLVAMSTQPANIKVISGSPGDEPSHEERDFLWDPFYARKEDEPEDHDTTRDAQSSYGMMA